MVVVMVEVDGGGRWWLAMVTVTEVVSGGKLMKNNDEHSAHKDEDSVELEVNGFEEPMQKKMRQLKSSVWTYMRKIVRLKDGVERAVCRGCKEPYKMYMDQQGNIQLRKIDQSISREKLAEAIIEHDLPYSFVEYKKIRAWADYVNPEIIMSSRNTAVVDVQKVYFKEKEKLRQALAKIPNQVCLIFYYWTTDEDELLKETMSNVDSNVIEGLEYITSASGSRVDKL
ncbi:hypothetical protein BC332_15149 [Capsicum chinense]|nr:hypothetical protein BC332_15149 [Capsicum chinense]